MLYTLTTYPFALVCIYYMFKFAKPKLMAMPVSVKSFTQFGEALHINGTAFMYFTGVLEASIVILLLASLFLSNEKPGLLVSMAGYLILLGTMGGALLTEFFVRPAPVQKLVAIALGLSAVAIMQLVLQFLRLKPMI